MPLPTDSSNIVTGNAALRVVKHRSSHVRLDVSLPPRTASSLDALALQYECPRAVVVRSLLRWALANRDWGTQGLLWRDD